MAFAPDARLIVNREVDMRSLPLTPVDFFVLSRVEALAGPAGVSVTDVLAASGHPDAESALAKLVELRALVVTQAKLPAPAPRERASDAQDEDLRQRTRDRRRQLLAAQMRAVTGGAAATEATSIREPRARDPRRETPPAESASEDSLPVARGDQKPAEPTEPNPKLRSILDTIEPVAPDDPRLDATLALSVDRQRQLLALRDRSRHIGHFEILGLEPIDDAKLIRRAYHIISRDLHPDTFYGKEIGDFRAVLDDLFRRARASYEFVLDDARRKTLVESHLAQVRAERERREQVELAPRAKREAEAEQRRAEAEAAAAAERERAKLAQEERERARQQRMRDLALAERRKQASAHAEQAVVEREAGRHGTAATLFRLAHEHDPTHPDYERDWRESLATARRQRGQINFQQGQAALNAGLLQAAAHHFDEAADADPSLRNLTEAAGAVAEFNPVRARELAMMALEVLAEAQAKSLQLDPAEVAKTHMACARAFLAAGQAATARDQAERAHEILANKQTRALLNSIKLA